MTSMQPRALWRVLVSTTSEAEDAVAQILQAQFGQPACSYTDAETGEAYVSVFLPFRPDRVGTRRSLQPALGRLTSCGLDPGSAEISLARVRRQNWAQSWKRHFQPLEFGRALLVKPSWSKRRAQEGQAVVVLDPGLSFGTGQHPTTSFCLRELVSHRDRIKPQSFLDLGTGSGILAIAAARLGYAPVLALEFDAEALQVARTNARRNGIARGIEFRQEDISKLPRRPRRRFSVVCANLVSDLLLEQRGRIVNRLAPGGVLVLAGILRTEFRSLQRHYEAAGLQLAGSRAEGEWRSGVFRAMARQTSGKYPTHG